MTTEFLLHKDRKEKGKPTAQKQECGCPSLQSSLRCHTHAFYQPTGDNAIYNGEGDHQNRSQNK